jgi:hypothetical protein
VRCVNKVISGVIARQWTLTTVTGVADLNATLTTPPYGFWKPYQRTPQARKGADPQRRLLGARHLRLLNTQAAP